MTKKKKIKIFDIIYGLAIMFLSVLVLIFSKAALLFIMGLLSITFFIFGIGRIIDAFFDKKLRNFGIIAKFITGLLASIIGMVFLFVIIIEPSFSISFLIILFAVVLLIIGIVRILIGILVDNYSMEYRFFLIIVGLLSFVVSIIILISSTLGYYILVLMISLILMVNGLARLLHGLYEERKS